MVRKYPEYKQLDLKGIHQEILQFWREHDIFRASVSTRADRPAFVFYEGPPSANGKPGIHHVMSRTIKDLFCRFKTLQGYLVERRAGWDTHGLPVELGVEKELGITKEDIGKSISVAAYNEACQSAVMRYTDLWSDLTEKMGYWVDMEKAYVTYRPQYMETLWWLLKQLWDKDLLYKGYTIQPYSPAAGTGLSSHELNMPGAYREVKDTSLVAQFEAIRDERFGRVFGELAESEVPVYYLAWTTTPWTLPSNTALTVGKNIDYQMIETFNAYTHQRQRVVLAQALVGRYFAAKAQNQPLESYQNTGKNIPWQVLWEGRGAELLELRYEQLLPWAQPWQGAEHAFRIIAGDFVTTEDGTGLVHTAPTFGADDAKVAQEAEPQVPPMLVRDQHDQLVPLVDLQGKFREGVGPLTGRYVKNEYYPAGKAPEKSVDVEIAIMLKEQNKAFKVEKYEHNYPHCWRTDKPVLYYPLDSWFVKVSDQRERLVALNQEINWKPASTGTGRFANWLENANDWNLSRSRFWGTPLPIWSTEDKKERRIFGSVAELKEACDEAVARGLMPQHPLQDFIPGDLSEANYQKVDLHRHVVDGIVLAASDGRPMYRENDLIDVWFDSGAMPYAQQHYPFAQGKGSEQPPQFPADFIAEGVDQTRGWFYTLHVISSLVFDTVAYINVVSNGLVLDKNGVKMSKRLGNAVDPFATIGTYGADAVRWYMISNAQPWDNLKFDLAGVEEVQRRFFGTLFHTYGFFALYANIDAYHYAADAASLPQERSELDRWILSRLQVLRATVSESYTDYEPTRAARAIAEFVDEELSNWYVRLCRRRFWKGEMNRDKQMAYDTLYTCLLDLAQMISPVAPFFADWLYGNLTAHLPEGQKEKSVHLSWWQDSRQEWIDERLNERMLLARRLSSMVFALRKKEGYKVRQPLPKMLIPVLDQGEAELFNSVKDLVLSEVNVKDWQLLQDAGDVLVKTVKPDFKKLGPRFGKQMKAVAAAIGAWDQATIQELESQGRVKIVVGDDDVDIFREDVQLSTEDIPGMLVHSENGLTVALDITLTEELRWEGLARELVNRIQNLRKDQHLAVTDRIRLTMELEEPLVQAARHFESYLKQETLAEEVDYAEVPEALLSDKIDGCALRISLRKS